MSTSLLYHAFGLKGVKYNSAEYIAGSVIFHAQLTRSVEICPRCKSWNTRRQRGSKVRFLRMIPIISRPTFLEVKIWRILCEDCGALRWPKLPFTEGKKRHTRRFAKFEIDLLHWMTISGAAKLLGVG